jgi:hypothetical protein
LEKRTPHTVQQFAPVDGLLGGSSCIFKNLIIVGIINECNENTYGLEIDTNPFNFKELNKDLRIFFFLAVLRVEFRA